MEIYFGTLALTVVLSLICQDQKKRKSLVRLGKKDIPTWIIWAILVPIPLVMLMGLRSYVGTDYREYLRILMEQDYRSKEIGFVWLNQLVNALPGNPSKILLFTIIAVLIVVGFEIGLLRYPSKDLAMSMFIFVAGGYFVNALNIQRQYIAMAFALIGWIHISEDWKDCWKFFLWVLLGSLFHMAVLILIPAYFIIRINWPVYLWIGLYAITIGMCFFKWDIIKLAYMVIGDHRRLNAMLAYFTSEMSPTLMLLFLGLGFVCFVFRKRLLQRDKKNIVLMNCMWIAMFGYTTLNYIFGGLFIERFVQCFAVLSILLIPELVDMLRSKGMRIFARVGVYVVFGLWLFRRLRMDSIKLKHMVPYAWDFPIDQRIFGIVCLVVAALLGIIWYMQNRKQAPTLSITDKTLPLKVKNPEVEEDSLVSIVVPIYNVQDYLDICVKSLVNQTYKNIEILLVDDGSPDECPRMCDEWKEKDDRIIACHKPNGGLSDARNYGVKESHGEYIAFVDSDDYVHEEYIRTMVDVLKRHDADLVACGRAHVDDQGNISFQHGKEREVEFTKEEALKDFFIPQTKMHVTAWNKLYKRKFFTENHIEYPVGKLYEDSLTTYKFYLNSEKMAYVDEPLYYYRHREGSIMRRKFSEDKASQMNSLDNIAVEDVKSAGYDLEDEFKIYEMINQINLANAIVDTDSDLEEVWSGIEKNIMENWDVYQKNPYLTKKQKLALWALRKGKKTYQRSRRIFSLIQKI